MDTIELGVSDAARTVQSCRQNFLRTNHETVTFSNLPLDDQLIDAFAEAAKPDWDGDGSVATAASTLALTKQFIESLPRKYQTPEISPEPDGHVDLEWFVGKRRLLLISVNPDGRLHWAALIGNEDPRGSCPFLGKAPKTILHVLRRVCRG